MLYSEFIKGTGCKSTPENLEIYFNLNTLYMNSNMTKEEIYEYGKKLVNNTKTPAEIELENRIYGDIKALQVENSEHRIRIAELQQYIKETNATLTPLWRDEIRERREQIKHNTNKIALLRGIIEKGE